MTKKILIATFYSVVLFCVISYISVMIPLLSSIGSVTSKPVTNIGFPFKYYYQFWRYSADSPNCGWNINYFILDFLIVWILTLMVYLFCNRKIK